MDDDFESWEGHVELRDRRDYPGIVALCEKEVSQDPSDLHAVERLGEAYVLNHQYDKAITVMKRYYHDYPNIAAFQYIILDALFAKGKTEDDFGWSIAPSILRPDAEVADICYTYLRPKRKPRSIGELHGHLYFRAYLTFTAQQLLKLLQADIRFEVLGEEPWNAEVRVQRL